MRHDTFISNARTHDFLLFKRMEKMQFAISRSTASTLQAHNFTFCHRPHFLLDGKNLFERKSLILNRFFLRRNMRASFFLSFRSSTTSSSSFSLWTQRRLTQHPSVISWILVFLFSFFFLLCGQS